MAPALKPSIQMPGTSVSLCCALNLNVFDSIPTKNYCNEKLCHLN